MCFQTLSRLEKKEEDGIYGRKDYFLIIQGSAVFIMISTSTKNLKK